MIAREQPGRSSPRYALFVVGLTGVQTAALKGSGLNQLLDLIGSDRLLRGAQSARQRVRSSYAVIRDVNPYAGEPDVGRGVLHLGLGAAGAIASVFISICSNPEP
jgi:hypothetical protein